MSQPLVSIVMCTFDGSRFIDEQIESILNQDYKNIELIIVDDVSTDDTWQKLENWRQQNPLISIHRNTANLGYNKNFEHAIQLANGEFIAISDQDDIWMPTKISKQVESLKKPAAILSHTRSVRLENGKLRMKSASLHNHYKGNDTRKLFMFNQINGHDMLFKKDLVNKSLPIPKRMMYDWWIAVMATCYGQIASVDEYLVHHRIHAANNYFNENKSKQEQLDMQDVLQLFATIDALAPEAKTFLNELLHLLKQHNTKPKGSLDVQLFRFLYKNRRLIFGHKKRLLPDITYIKYAVKYARLEYAGKGIKL